MARVQSVDILRGATIILMIVVNNPGNWALRWAPLRHAVWNGLTLTDLVFPLFLFVMGVSMYFSLSRGGFKLSWKMLRRVLLLIFLGLLLNWGSAALWAHTYSLDTLRFTGVLQRFALCFALTALIVCLLPRKSVPWIALILLVGYSVALLLGNGYAYSPENIIARVDNALIPAKHLYNDNGIDPEGILSTIPSLSHTLIGFMFGELIAKHRNRELMTRAIIGIATGVLISIWLPINKKIWSPSFVLVACGIGALLLGLLYYLTDEKKIWKNAGFFKSFGTNAIYCYVVSHIVGWGFIICGFQRLFAAANSAWISFLYSLVVVMVVWLTVLPLYKKNIYIKV
jgi:predicted acyltransferase